MAQMIELSQLDLIIWTVACVGGGIILGFIIAEHLWFRTLQRRGLISKRLVAPVKRRAWCWRNGDRLE